MIAQQFRRIGAMLYYTLKRHCRSQEKHWEHEEPKPQQPDSKKHW